MIHDARVVPMTSKPHLPSKLRQLHGDPRGRWEGDTLVVETTNYINGFQGSTRDVKLTERYTRVAADVLNYEATITDANVFTRPWKIQMPLYRRLEKNAQLMDFKCVEFVEELLYGQWRKRPLTKD